MKKTLIILLSLFVGVSSYGQKEINAQEFSTVFKEVFDTSIRGLDKISNQAPILPSSDNVGITLDKSKGIYIYKAEYFVKSKDEAKALKKELANLVTLNVPQGDYKKKESYGAEYFDYLKYTFEFDTKTFAEVKKRPVIQIGTMKTDNGYTIELLILEPFFKNQY